MPFCASHPIPSLDKVLDFFPKTCIKNQNPSELHNLSESPLWELQRHTGRKKYNIEGSEVRTHT